MRDFFPVYKPTITNKEIEYSRDAINSGWISSIGEYITRFEKAFALFCGTKYAICTSSGTTGLHLALYSLGIGEGDEVIVPDFTFIATANAVKYVDATPVFVDIEKDTLCINPEKIIAAITSKTKAIIPVHVYGHPANMTEINKIARDHNLLVIEDCAEAHGAEINSQRVGSMGVCGVFSFYGNKIITTGEGGMITTNNELLFQQSIKLRDHAMSKEKKYWHDSIGFNYRMTNVQAAIGLAQLERIEEIISKKRLIFNYYGNFLKSIKNIKLNSQKVGYKNVYWMICLQIENFTEIERNNFINDLREKGIDSRPFFYPISDMPMYNKISETPVAHEIFKTGINLPSYYDLQEEDIGYICEQVKLLLS